MSSGFEVRQINVDKNPLKKLKAQDEEIFTIQVGLFEYLNTFVCIRMGLVFLQSSVSTLFCLVRLKVVKSMKCF